MSHYLIDRIQAATNITVMTKVEVTAACGNAHLERIDLRHIDTGLPETLHTAALFVFIGVAPRTEMLAGFAYLDDKGFVVTGPDLRRASAGWTLDRDPLLFETNVQGRLRRWRRPGRRQQARRVSRGRRLGRDLLGPSVSANSLTLIATSRDSSRRHFPGTRDEAP